MKRLGELFWAFFRIGALTFGGGYAMIALLDHECVEKRQWLTADELMDITVVAESTPGPIAINCATFTGYRQAGFFGALAATLGIVFPSFAVIYVISRFLDHFLEITLIAHAFQGIKIGAGLLILDAAVVMIQKMPKKLLPRIIMIFSAAAMLMISAFSWNFSSISLMLTAAAVSLCIFLLKEMSQKKGGASS